jgi:hypothetical protein
MPYIEAIIIQTKKAFFAGFDSCSYKLLFPERSLVDTDELSDGKKLSLILSKTLLNKIKKPGGKISTGFFV